MGMVRFKFSPLPAPPAQYDQVHFNQLIRSLELYFSRLDSGAALEADDFFGRGVGLEVPYLQALVDGVQTPDVADTVQDVVFDYATAMHTYLEDGKAQYSGVYEIYAQLAVNTPTGDTQAVAVSTMAPGVVGGIAVSLDPGASLSIAVPTRYVRAAQWDQFGVTWQASDVGVELATGSLLVRWVSAQ